MAAGSVQVSIVVVGSRFPQKWLEFATIDVLHDHENGVCEHNNLNMLKPGIE